MKITAIIPAAGKGERMGHPISKQFLPLKGKPILVHTLERMNAVGLIDEIILVVPEQRIDWAKEEIRKKYRIAKLKKVVRGGKKRQESVYAGLEEVDGKPDIIVIHDGVRPFFTPSIISQAIPLLKKYDGVIEALPLNDTIKEVNRNELILRTVEREKLYRALTPQIFNYGILVKAFSSAFKNGYSGTDEAELVERVKGKIKILRGSEFNIKITSPDDLLLAKAIIDASGK